MFSFQLLCCNQNVLTFLRFYRAPSDMPVQSVTRNLYTQRIRGLMNGHMTNLIAIKFILVIFAIGHLRGRIWYENTKKMIMKSSNLKANRCITLTRIGLFKNLSEKCKKIVSLLLKSKTYSYKLL